MSSGSLGHLHAHGMVYIWWIGVLSIHLSLPVNNSRHETISCMEDHFFWLLEARPLLLTHTIEKQLSLQSNGSGQKSCIAMLDLRYFVPYHNNASFEW